MPFLRDRPYASFNFLVDLGHGRTEAGFQECSGLGPDLTVADYRSGNERDARGRRLTGSNRSPQVTLKRGVFGAEAWRAWLEQHRSGDTTARRTFTVQLLNDDRSGVVRTWKLIRPQIIKHTSGPLNAKGTDVAMEELTLACEGIELE